MSISVQNVSKLYGAQRALSQVQFEIGKGEIVGFLGPNGAGKSTMMKIITGFIPPSEGKVEVCGHDVEESPLDTKRSIGYLPEHNPQYLEMYVKEYLLFAAGVHKVKNAKDRVNEMIDLVGLTPERHKKIGALSKGYRQRVGLAQALLHDPEVLILDEPTTGLDPNQIVEIRDLIKRIGSQKTVMMSTHIMQEVEAVCDRVIIINKGKIVADKPTDEVRNLSQTGQLVRLQIDRAADLGAIKNLEGVSKVSSADGLTIEVKASGDKDIRPALFQWAVDNNIKILELHNEELGLEDVFRQLTGS